MTESYTGRNNVSMDSKGRVMMPVNFRDLLARTCGSRIVITIDLHEPCLVIYPYHRWTEIEENFSARPGAGAKLNQIKRLLLGHAKSCELDSAGRFLIPQYLRQYAELDSNVSVVGIDENKIEVWDDIKWEENLQKYSGKALKDDETTETMLQGLDFNF